MAKTIAEKLQIKPSTELLFTGATAEQRALINPLPNDVTAYESVDRNTYDAAVLFAEDRTALDERLDKALPHLVAARATWIAYPKGNKTDINRDSIWRRAEEVGWTINGNISLSETWSAVRIKPMT